MSKTILIVDDSQSIREILSLTLKNAGFNVIEAQHGKEAIENLTDSTDLIITDLHMPVMDGITLIKELRQMEKFKYIPIIFLTTESQAEKKEEAKAAGATGWITKPFVPEKILVALSKVIR